VRPCLTILELFDEEEKLGESTTADKLE